jgi:hypothetical protein
MAGDATIGGSVSETTTSARPTRKDAGIDETK